MRKERTDARLSSLVVLTHQSDRPREHCEMRGKRLSLSPSPPLLLRRFHYRHTLSPSLATPVKTKGLGSHDLTMNKKKYQRAHCRFYYLYSFLLSMGRSHHQNLLNLLQSYHLSLISHLHILLKSYLPHLLVSHRILKGRCDLAMIG